MNKRALTMLELIVVIGIIGFSLAGILISYVSSLNLSEYDKNLTIAMNIAREKMEELSNKRLTNYDDLGIEMCFGCPTITDLCAGCSITGSSTSRVISYNNTYVQNQYGFNGSCAIYIKDIDPIPGSDNLKEARVVVCWKQRLGRIIGEDKNLNGKYDTGEDMAGGYSSELDSPCELISAFAKR